MFKKIILLILLTFQFCIYSVSGSSEPKGKELIGNTVIAVVDNLRIRESSDLNSKITGHMNTGDTADVTGVSDVTFKVKDKEDYWYKIKTTLGEGWVFGGLITDQFSSSRDKNIILWTDGNTWNDEAINVNYYSRTSKKKNSYKLESGECSDLVLSPDGKYFVQDCGTDAIRSIGFFIAESGRHIDHTSYIGDMKWTGNNRMELENVVFVSVKECCYAYVVSVFENGKLTKGKNSRLGDGCCKNVYRVNVPVLKIYDTPGGSGKVKCTLNKDEYIDVDDKQDDKTGAWVKVTVDLRCKKDKGNYYNDGYVLKSELRKGE